MPTYARTFEWTEENTKFLEENWSSKPAQAIADHLGCTKYEALKKAGDLELPKKGRGVASVQNRHPRYVPFETTNEPWDPAKYGRGVS